MSGDVGGVFMRSELVDGMIRADRDKMLRRAALRAEDELEAQREADSAAAADRRRRKLEAEAYRKRREQVAARAATRRTAVTGERPAAKEAEEAEEAERHSNHGPAEVAAFLAARKLRIAGAALTSARELRPGSPGAAAPSEVRC